MIGRRLLALAVLTLPWCRPDPQGERVNRGVRALIEEVIMGLGRDFMLKTRYEHLGPSDQSRGVAQPPLEAAADPSAPRIRLPDVAAVELGAMPLKDAIARRTSVREYAAIPLSLEELSFLLWATQGIRRLIPGAATLRTVPSAGARHAFETFLLVNRVAGVSHGIFRYEASRHQLVTVDTSAGVAHRAVEGCLGQRFVAASAVTFIWAAVPYRMTWRYGERGYRYLHLDAGHVCQNLYLAAESIGCGACAIAAFDDEAMNRLIGVDGEEMFVIYVATVGRTGGSRT